MVVVHIKYGDTILIEEIRIWLLLYMYVYEYYTFFVEHKISINSDSSTYQEYVYRMLIFTLSHNNMYIHSEIGDHKHKRKGHISNGRVLEIFFLFCLCGFA